MLAPDNPRVSCRPTGALDEHGIIEPYRDGIRYERAFDGTPAGEQDPCVKVFSVHSYVPVVSGVDSLNYHEFAIKVPLVTAEDRPAARGPSTPSRKPFGRGSRIPCVEKPKGQLAGMAPQLQRVRQRPVIGSGPSASELIKSVFCLRSDVYLGSFDRQRAPNKTFRAGYYTRSLYQATPEGPPSRVQFVRVRSLGGCHQELKSTNGRPVAPCVGLLVKRTGPQVEFAVVRR